MRAHDCGHAATEAGGAVGLRVKELRPGLTVAGYAGLATCGRIWLCPVCNAKIMAERAVEVGAVLTWAEAQGYRVLFGSLTVRHNARSNLRQLMYIQREAWEHVVNSREWRAASACIRVEHEHGSPHCKGEDCDKEFEPALHPTKKGRVGYIRASEITEGEANGWHPHYHPLIIWRGTAAAATRFAARVVSLWVEGVKKAGGDAQVEGGQKLSVLARGKWSEDVSAYIAKSTYDYGKLALEAVWSQGKTGLREKQGKRWVTVTLPYWSLLAAIADDKWWALQRWDELEAAMDGARHRMITWSLGLRAFAGLNDQETADETIAERELGTIEDTVCVITPEGWHALRDTPEAVAQVLDVLETSGWAMVRQLLDAWGVGWTTIDDLSGHEDFAASSRAAERERRSRPAPERAQRIQEDWVGALDRLLGDERSPVVPAAAPAVPTFKDADFRDLAGRERIAGLSAVSEP